MKLPVIENCDDCGACCRQTPVPPFDPGEEITRDVPRELLKLVESRIAAEQQFELLPCVWYDADLDRCRHYEFRPTNCRVFEVGSDACRMARNAMEIDG